MRSSGNTSVGKITTIQPINKLKFLGKLTSEKNTRQCTRQSCLVFSNTRQSCLVFSKADTNSSVLISVLNSVSGFRPNLNPWEKIFY